MDTCLIQNLVCDPCWAICRVDGLFPPEGPRKDQERGAEAKTVSVTKLILVPSTQMKSSGRLQFPTPQTSLSCANRTAFIGELSDNARQLSLNAASVGGSSMGSCASLLSGGDPSGSVRSKSRPSRRGSQYANRVMDVDFPLAFLKRSSSFVKRGGNCSSTLND